MPQSYVYYGQPDSGGVQGAYQFSDPDPVGAGVHEDGGFTIGFVTNDAWPDIIIGNQLFINPGVRVAPHPSPPPPPPAPWCGTLAAGYADGVSSTTDVPGATVLFSSPANHLPSAEMCGVYCFQEPSPGCGGSTAGCDLWFRFRSARLGASRTNDCECLSNADALPPVQTNGVSTGKVCAVTTTQLPDPTNPPRADAGDRVPLYFTIVAGAGNYNDQSTGDRHTATGALVDAVSALYYTEATGLVFAERADRHVVRRVAGGVMFAVAGAEAGWDQFAGGATVLAENARFDRPSAFAPYWIGTNGILLADQMNCLVRELQHVGTDLAPYLVIYAGTGTCDTSGSGNNVHRQSASLGRPTDLVVDSLFNPYIADPLTGVVWTVDASTQALRVYAGVVGCHQNMGTTSIVSKTTQCLMNPQTLALDSNGLLYVFTQYELVKVDLVGFVTLITGAAVGGGLDGLKGVATLGNIHSMYVDPSNNDYIVVGDCDSNRVRVVQVSSGTVGSLSSGEALTSPFSDDDVDFFHSGCVCPEALFPASDGVYVACRNDVIVKTLGHFASEQAIYVAANRRRERRELQKDTRYRANAFASVRSISIGQEPLESVKLAQVDGMPGLDLVGVKNTGKAVVYFQDDVQFVRTTGTFAPLTANLAAAPGVENYILMQGHCLGQTNYESTAANTATACAAVCSSASADRPCRAFTFIHSRVSATSNTELTYRNYLGLSSTASASSHDCHLHRDSLSSAIPQLITGSSQAFGMYCYNVTTRGSEAVEATVLWRGGSELGEFNDVTTAATAIRAEWGSTCKLRDGCVRTNMDIFTVSRNGGSKLYNNPDTAGLGGSVPPLFHAVDPVYPLPEAYDQYSPRDATDIEVALTDVGDPSDDLPSFTQAAIVATKGGSRNVVQLPMPGYAARPIGEVEHGKPAAHGVAVLNNEHSGIVGFALGADDDEPPNRYRNRLYFFPKAAGSPEILRVLGFTPPSPPNPPPSPPPPPPPSPPPPPPPHPPPPPPAPLVRRKLEPAPPPTSRPPDLPAYSRTTWRRLCAARKASTGTTASARAGRLRAGTAPRCLTGRQSHTTCTTSSTASPIGTRTTSSLAACRWVRHSTSGQTRSTPRRARSRRTADRCRNPITIAPTRSRPTSGFRAATRATTGATTASSSCRTPPAASSTPGTTCRRMGDTATAACARESTTSTKTLVRARALTGTIRTTTSSPG